jgi:hypothetical protein
MKKNTIFLILLALGFVGKTYSQVTFSPTIYTAEDQVTLTVDVTGTPMAGQAEAFIWIFSNPTNGTGPQNNGTVNGAWGSSSDQAKLTAAGTNRWSFTFTGTTLFGLTPGELKEFGFLLKSRNGSLQTPDYKPYKFDPLVFTATMLRVFPAKVGQDDAITVNFDQNLAASVNEQRMTPTTVTVTVFDQNSAQFGMPITLNVRSLGNKMFSAVFIPTRSYTLTTGTRLTRFRYRFNGTVPSASGGTTNVSSSEGETPLVEMK